MELNKKVKLRVPTTPNYILSEDGHSFPVGNFTVEELQQIGAEWTKALIENAAKKRLI